MWNTFIHPFDKPFFFQKIGNRPHDFENLRRRIPSSHDQPAVSPACEYNTSPERFAGNKANNLLPS